jgi:hypothetical protein
MGKDSTSTYRSRRRVVNGGVVSVVMMLMCACGGAPGSSNPVPATASATAAPVSAIAALFIETPPGYSQASDQMASTGPMTPASSAAAPRLAQDGFLAGFSREWIGSGATTPAEIDDFIYDFKTPAGAIDYSLVLPPTYRLPGVPSPYVLKISPSPSSDETEFAVPGVPDSAGVEYGPSPRTADVVVIKHSFLVEMVFRSVSGSSGLANVISLVQAQYQALP